MDTETTGTDKNSDSIIEIALKRILVDMSTFEIRDICEEYQSFNDPVKTNKRDQCYNRNNR